MEHGALARRLVTALGETPDRERIREVWAELVACLRDNRPFTPETS